MRNLTKCVLDGCDNRSRTKKPGLCHMHYHRRLRGSVGGDAPKARHCAYCEKALVGVQRKFCSAHCQTRHVRGTPTTRQCTECGTNFPTWEKRLVCSDECRKTRDRRRWREMYNRCSTTETFRARLRKNQYLRRAREFGTREEPISPIDIFRRDGWKCQLCGKPTKRAAIWPDPMFPSLDHIVPLALGGGHVRENVQCAHLVCNLRKSDRALGQLRLFG